MSAVTGAALVFRDEGGELVQIVRAHPCRDGALRDVGGVVVQQFSLENGRSFTVAQGKPSDAFLPEGEGVEVTVRGVAGTVYEDAENGRSLVTWLEGDLQIWVGGDLTADEALAVANSLE